MHNFRQTGQLRDMNTIGFVRFALDNAVQEFDFAFVFAHVNVDIAQIIDRFFEFRQFVIMGGKQRFRADGRR